MVDRIFCAFTKGDNNLFRKPFLKFESEFLNESELRKLNFNQLTIKDCKRILARVLEHRFDRLDSEESECEKRRIIGEVYRREVYLSFNGWLRSTRQLRGTYNLGEITSELEVVMNGA